MKYALTILLCSLIFLSTFSCKKGSGPGAQTDSSFSGSYLQLTINGKYYMEKDVTISGNHVVQITVDTGATPYTGKNSITIYLVEAADIYGLGHTQPCTINAFGNGVGTYSMAPSRLGGFPSQIYTNTNPAVQYNCDSLQTLIVTYDGPDYIAGTINTTFSSYTPINLYNVPVTGSFKIYR